ncbi:MAG: hypothetical protein FWG11_05970 [Promicromonosporaceae bacterium]|nr:hypothetical protein [Promicromonosporaceae bacterium]
MPPLRVTVAVVVPVVKVTFPVGVPPPALVTVAVTVREVPIVPDAGLTLSFVVEATAAGGAAATVIDRSAGAGAGAAAGAGFGLVLTGLAGR